MHKLSALLLYCRAGFENDTANEIQQLASEHGVFGYIKAKSNSGYAVFECYQPEQAEILHEKVSLTQLIFTRQWFVITKQFERMDPTDRVGEILSEKASIPICSEVRVEHPDTEQGKELAKFCRKFLVPLRQALKKHEVLKDKVKKEQAKCLFVFFIDNQSCYLGYAFSNNCSPQPLGILRLKASSQAPSRSSNKLDEAFQIFIAKGEHPVRLHSGMHAVDLGACPGGWTYQLVKRGMLVQAIDNGLMADSLMETGQVQHFQEDGFVYEPKKKNVTWLVCDMVEKPQRVAKLMAEWVAKEWCVESIFNLKLPMKKRFECVSECLEIVRNTLLEKGCKHFQLQVKHLYHDREEITVHLRRL